MTHTHTRARAFIHRERAYRDSGSETARAQRERERGEGGRERERERERERRSIRRLPSTVYWFWRLSEEDDDEHYLTLLTSALVCLPSPQTGLNGFTDQRGKVSTFTVRDAVTALC